MSASFLSDIEALPANGSEDHSHIIDISTYQPSNESNIIRVWDAVAIMLYSISPDILINFLDLTKEEFKLRISPTIAMNAS